MASPEEIAREAALALVTLSHDEREPGFHGWHAEIGGLDVSAYRPQADAETSTNCFRSLVAAAVLAAIERALREVPVPGGLSEGDLEGMRRMQRSAVGWMPGVVDGVIGDLLAHVEHLTRALHDCGQDGSAVQWAAGYEAGKAAQWAAGFRAGFAARAEEQ